MQARRIKEKGVCIVADSLFGRRNLDPPLYLVRSVPFFCFVVVIGASAGAQPCAAVWAARLGRSGGGGPNEC